MATSISEVQDEQRPPAPDLSALAEQLVAAARRQGVELTGPGGLLTGLTKQVLETALDVELSDHLGHDRGERSGSGNVRNGSSGKRLARPEAAPLRSFRTMEAPGCSDSWPEPCRLSAVARERSDRAPAVFFLRARMDSFL